MGDEERLVKGQIAMICGLASKPELNGEWCILHGWKAERERHVVELTNGKYILLKPANLQNMQEASDVDVTPMRPKKGRLPWEDPFPPPGVPSEEDMDEAFKHSKNGDDYVNRLADLVEEAEKRADSERDQKWIGIEAMQQRCRDAEAKLAEKAARAAAERKEYLENLRAEKGLSAQEEQALSHQLFQGHIHEDPPPLWVAQTRGWSSDVGGADKPKASGGVDKPKASSSTA